VSYCQSGVDYSKVKSSGIGAVLIRAGYGRETYQKDSQFEAHYRNAKANGLPVGAYWYSYANSVEDAKREAKACLACINGKKFDYPIYYDMEESWQAQLGKSLCTAMAKAFCEAIVAAGYKAGGYANLNWFNNYLDYESLKKSHSIWLAQWASSCSKDCDIWQYSDNGKISGISGNVDLDLVIKLTSTSSTTSTTQNRNATVKDVQTWLNNTYKSGLVVDGIYGANTKAALVKALQTELNKRYNTGLVVDGIYGSKTNAAVRNIAYGTSGNLVKVLQGLIICNGYTLGLLDGIYGYQTINAVRNYQSAHKLNVDGVAGKNTFASLCK
ncbi:MAG: GH25 family lysozyme, partial [Ruminococcus sp.]